MTQTNQTSAQPDTTAVVVEIRTQVGKELGIDVAEVSPDTVLKQLPGADSVRLLRVVAQVERIYDVEFEDEDVFRVRTAQELADLVTSQSAEGA